MANPLQVHLISKAKIKTDAIDARVLAQLYAAGFLPEVWIPDAATLARRRQVTRRTQLIRQRVRLKSIVQSILHANLVPQCPFTIMMNSPKLTTVPLPPANGRSIGGDSRRPTSQGMPREAGRSVKTGENSRPTNGEDSTAV